jgi:hypothetical protein
MTHQIFLSTRALKTKFCTGVLIFPFLLISTLAYAQLETLKATTPEQRATAITDIMKTKLELSGSETERISEINLAFAKKAEPIIKSSDNRLKIGLKLRKINRERSSELKKVLSTKQLKILEESKAEIRKAMLSTLKNETGVGVD